MDSFQFWLYVIIGVIYFISRMRKKQAGQAGEAPENRQGPARERERVRPANPDKGTGPKAFTFEELLKEITESKTPREPEPVVDYDDDLQDEIQDLEDVEYDYRRDDETFATYEEAKKQAFLRPSLEETMKVGDTVVNFGKFKEFEARVERNIAKEYLKELRNPSSVRKAVVMSEILRPKF
jgi:hypothetical protein